ATNPTPSISELRKPRPSRRTPAEGVASTAAEPSVLQALVKTNGNNAPMPSTRPSAARPAALPLAPPNMVTPFAVSPQPAPPPSQPAGPPYAMAPQTGPYANPYATGPQQLADNPFATGAQPMPAHPFNTGANPYMTGQQPVAQHPYMTGQQPAAQHPYSTGQQSVAPNPFATGQQPVNPYITGQQPVAQNPFATGQQAGPPPVANSPFPQGPYGQQPYNNPYGQSPQFGGPQYPFAPQGGQQRSPSLQMMQLDVDELPAHYRIDNKRPKTVLVVLAGIAAISLAAFATFFIVKSTRKAPAVQGSVRVDSVPAGAAVSVDGKVLPNITPLTINNLPAGTSHDLVLTLVRHKQYTTKIEVPKAGGVIPVTAIMTPITGTLRVTSIPAGAELYINGQFRNRTPCTISDVDMEGVKQIELRLKEYTPQKVPLNWLEKSELDVEVKMTK
ncbi:MAG TPA: PEGA domain-containing protein, partial [Kofleriaceae bacterium]|nr:PEGA domain-containing protein [Kofleriaceae bacterium]